MNTAGDDATTAPNVTEHLLDGEKYLALMKEFKALRLDYDHGAADPLLAAFNQLASALLFFNNDPVVQYHSLTLPLERLLANLHDRLRGAAAPLLDRVNRSAGASTDLFHNLMRGQIAGALGILVAVGMKPAAAAEWLGRECNRLRIRHPNGAKISVKQLNSWRYKVQDGKAPASQRQAAEEIRQRWASRPASTDDVVEAAKRNARDVLKVAKHFDFGKTPRFPTKR